MDANSWENELLEKYNFSNEEQEISLNYSMKNFSHFKVNDFKVDLKWQNDLKKMVINYIQKKDYQNYSICLFGCSGSGKTHLSCAIGNYLIKNNIKIIRHDFFELVQSYTASFFKGDPVAKFFSWNLLKNYCDFVIIEDFLKEVNPNSKRAAFAIIDYLYTNKINFILNGEISIEKLKEVDIAIYGRIKQMSKNYIFEIPNHIKNNYRLRE